MLIHLLPVLMSACSLPHRPYKEAGGCSSAITVLHSPLAAPACEGMFSGALQARLVTLTQLDQPDCTSSSILVVGVQLFG